MQLTCYAVRLCLILVLSIHCPYNSERLSELPDRVVPDGKEIPLSGVYWRIGKDLGSRQYLARVGGFRYCYPSLYLDEMRGHKAGQFRGDGGKDVGIGMWRGGKRGADRFCFLQFNSAIRGDVYVKPYLEAFGEPGQSSQRRLMVAGLKACDG